MNQNNPQKHTGDQDQSTGSRKWFLHGLALSLIVWVSASAWAQGSITAALAPGVVIDADGQRAFMLEPEGLTARELKDGTSSWQLAGEIEPLGLQAGQLIAVQATTELSKAELLRIDPATGRIDDRLELSFPPDVRVRISDRPGERFQAQLLQSSDSIRVHWRYSRHPLRGAPAISGINRPPKLPGRPNPSTGDSEAQTDYDSGQGQHLSEHESGIIVITGSGAEALVSMSEAGWSDPSARHWNELRGEERRAGPAGRQFTASSDEAVLISQRMESEQALGMYRWTVLDSNSQPIGELETRYAFAPFALSGERLAYVARPWLRVEGDRLVENQELALVVIDLTSGSEVWQAALLDKAWRGSMPP